MLIESVELRNIKSYSEPSVRIPFRQGVNLIWGDNGSGKTTILEAIGYALFGAIDYNLAQFIREGTDEGEIVLTFEGNDERFYQVVRNLKNTAKLEIYDVETKRKLVSKRQDAEDWLTDNIGVEFGGFGKKLFENALGVAQGKMTGSFLENETARKAIFAPILRVDEYDTAWSRLGKMSTELSARINTLVEEIARLEGRLEKYPESERQLESLATQITDGERLLAKQSEHLTEQRTVLAIFETSESALKEAERKLKEENHQAALLAEQVASAKNAWQESKDASRLVKDCQSGYGLYTRASTQRKKLLAQQEEYNRGREQLLGIEGNLGETQASLASLAEQLKNISSAEKRMQELEPLVQRQVQLEGSIEQYRTQVKEYENALDRARQADLAIPTLRQHLEGVRHDLNRRSEINNQLLTQQDPLQTLQIAITRLSTDEEGMQIEYRELGEGLLVAQSDARKFEEAERNLQQAEQTWAATQERLGEVVRQIQERVSLDKQIQHEEDEVQKYQTELSRARAKEQQCVQRATELQERLDMLHNAELAECPVCKRPLDEHDAYDIENEFQIEIDSWKEKEKAARQVAQDADREISALQKQESSLKKRRDKLPTEERANELNAEITEQQELIESFRSSMDSLAKAPQRVGELEAARKDLADRIAAQRQLLHARRNEVGEVQYLINQLNSELGNLAQPAQAADLEDRIAGYEKEATEWKAVADGLTESPVHLEAELAALEEVNDPRTEQNKLRGIADQRSAIEAEQQRLEHVKAEYEIRRQEQELALQSYAGLDQALIDVNECIEKNEKAYQDYLANQKIASALAMRKKQFDTVRELHKEQTALCVTLNAEWQEAQAKYDSEQHAKLRKEIGQLEREITRLEAQLGEWRGQYQELEREVLQLRQQQIDLNISCQQQARLDRLAEVFRFVREGIRRAGPQIVRQRAKAISYNADRIFQDIIGDPSLSLSWDETYAIKVFRRREERVFNQLSGGEQMAAAIAVRLALMIQMSDLRILFLDEPTANMDDTRRDKLADHITSIEGLKQIFVITHDDAFRRDSHNFIQISKQDGASIVQVGG